MKYAIIQNERVVNIIESDSTNAERISASMGAIVIQSDVAGIGMIYNSDGSFSPAPPAIVTGKQIGRAHV